MFGRAALLLMIAVSVLAMPAAAQAPAPTTAFDGKYVGVFQRIIESGKQPGRQMSTKRPTGSTDDQKRPHREAGEFTYVWRKQPG